MRRNRDTGNDTPGYDSFLDIVANLVGILVILIMVLGVRARDAWQTTGDESLPATVAVAELSASSDALGSAATSVASDAPIPPDDDAVLSLSPPNDAVDDFSLPPLDEPTSEPLDNGFAAADPTIENPTFPNLTSPSPTQPEALELPDVETARIEAENMRQASYEIDTQLTQVDGQLTAKSAYRDQLLAALNVAQEQVASYNSQLAAVTQEQNAGAEEIAKELAAATDRLVNIQGQIDRVAKAEKPEVIALTHRPAPMAQTVFGREEHFRLHAGRLSYVPMLEIRDRVKGELKNKAWKLKQAPRVMETFGPIGDYYVRYEMVRSQRKIRTESGPVMRSIISLDYFELAPTSEVLGMPVAEALKTGSQFQQLLSQYSPGEVTVTVWTYPDSYSQLRQLKESLWQSGYLVATRPLPHGVPIGASPDGSRSMAE